MAKLNNSVHLVYTYSAACTPLLVPGKEKHKGWEEKEPYYMRNKGVVKMFSQQRRAERYRILYTWKVLEGKVPNCGIQSKSNDRRGRECLIPLTRGTPAVQNLRHQSFQMAGPQLFNSLPRTLRDLEKIPIEDFKEKLDLFLATIPDHPKIGDMVPNICNQITAKPSNSLIDVILHQKNIYGGG